MTSTKITILSALFALLCVFFLQSGVAYASYSLTGLHLTSTGLLTWNNSGFSGSCVANLYGRNGGGGYWGNVGCSTYNSGINLNAAMFGAEQCPLNTSYGMNGSCAFQLNNYNGQGASNFVPIYYTGGDTWSLTYLEPPPSITITSPTNGATITDASTHIVGTYQHLHIGLWGWGNLWIELKNHNSGVYSEIYFQQITAASGTFSFPISTFGVAENGQWDIVALQEFDANTFQELTPSPLYDFVFNIGGLPTPYQFSNFNTWYSSNAAGGYTEPSDWANSLTSFIQPIFVNAGEFVNNSLMYFKSTDFYSKGNQLGLIFPTTQAYLNKINIFFGGFPLIQFFEMLTFVMLGIFIVRTIFKFIPFFG